MMQLLVMLINGMHDGRSLLYSVRVTGLARGVDRFEEPGFWLLYN